MMSKEIQVKKYWVRIRRIVLVIDSFYSQLNEIRWKIVGKKVCEVYTHGTE